MRFARPSLDFVHVRGTLPILLAPVAQLDRASDYGSEGCVFESRRVQIKSYSRFADNFTPLKLTISFKGTAEILPLKSDVTVSPREG